MIFPWKTVLQWVLPTIPQIISTVRTMQKEHYVLAQPSSTEDLLARIEKLEKSLELQTHMNEESAKQLQQLETRLRITTFIGLLGLILGLLALAFAVFH
jgi:vacuolar-type H+-ATPase catalytic subunit A/Vma1